MPQPSARDHSDATFWMYGKTIDEVDHAMMAGDLVGSEVNLADYDACLRYLKGTGYPENQIHLVKGWFQKTLPAMRDNIGPIAILRIDGDLYESTRVVLDHLFDSVVERGVVIIDDYGAFAGCREAVDEFLVVRKINPFLHYVENSIRFFIKE